MRVTGRLAAVFGYVILATGVGYAIDKVEGNIHDQTVSRVTTVAQRCELTEIVLGEALRPDSVVRLQKSLKGCRAQLAKLEKQSGAHPVHTHP